jgi:hypothetical protein
MSDVVTKSAFALLVGVSAGRVSQFLSEKKIFSDAIVGEGRHARIRVSVALEQLKRSLDLSQRLGANGRARLDDPLSIGRGNAGDVSAVPDTVENSIKAQRLEQLELANERAREDKAARAGVYLKADEARQEMGRIAARLMTLFDGALGEFATAIAAHSNLSARDALHLLRTTFRTIRDRSSQTEIQAAAELLALVEDRELSADASVGPEGDEIVDIPTTIPSAEAAA